MLEELFNQRGQTMKLSKYFIKRPTLFWSLMVAIILGGIYSYSKMPKLEDPEISIKQANVVVLYPGASAHEVELEAVSVLEEALRSMPEVNYISSESSNGMGPGNGRDENDSSRKSDTTILGSVTPESQ